MISLDLRKTEAPRARAGVDADIALLSALHGGASSTPLTSSMNLELVAVVSEAAAIWGRRLSMAAVDPAGVVDAAALYRIAWGLAFKGEVVEVIGVRNGRVTLTPAVFHEVDHGGDDLTDPDGWLYRLDISTPDQQIEVHTRGAGVCHFRLPGPDLWRGQHVLARAQETKALLSAIERQLVDEASTPSKVILPLPEGTDEPTRDSLRSELMRRMFRIAMPATTAAGGGDGRTMAPLSDWKPMRLQAQPTEELVKLRSDLAQSGVEHLRRPASVRRDSTGGTSRLGSDASADNRESVAALVRDELSRKLERPYVLTFAPQPADVTMAARAVKALVDAGYSRDEASTMAGLS